MLSPRFQINWRTLLAGFLLGILFIVVSKTLLANHGHKLIEAALAANGKGATMDPNKINPTDLTQLKIWLIGENPRYLPGSIGFITDFRSGQDWMEAQTPEIQEQYTKHIKSFFATRKFPTYNLSIIKKILIYARELAEITRQYNLDILDPVHADYIYKILKNT